MHLQGEGVAQNAFEAAKWIQMSANQDYAKGEMNLGFLYADGEGVQKNSVTAIYWLRKAAEQGDAGAELGLGSVYAKGEIVKADYIEAYKWLTLAAAQGDGAAAKQRDDLVDKMSPEGISQAQKAAADFAPVKKPTAVNSATGSGTGFFVAKEGYFLTANHVIDGASKIVIKTKYLAFAARVIKVDKTNDLVLLKVYGAFPPAALTNEALLQISDTRLAGFSSKFRPLSVAGSADVKLGDSISTLGFPNPELQGSAPKFTRGEINSLAGIRDDPHYFQISAPIQPGNSGGPLLDRSGNVVGIIQLTLNDAKLFLVTGVVPQNVNYALKGDYLLRFLKSVPAVTLTQPPPADPAAQPNDWVSDAQSSIALVLVF